MSYDLERRILAYVHKYGPCPRKDVLRALPGCEDSLENLLLSSMLRWDNEVMPEDPEKLGEATGTLLVLGSFSMVWSWQEMWTQRRLAEACGLEETRGANSAYWRCTTSAEHREKAYDHLFGDPFEQDPSTQVGIIRACLLPPYEELSQEAVKYLDAYWSDKTRQVVETRVRAIREMHQVSVRGSEHRNLGISTDALTEALGHAFMEGFLEGIEGRKNGKEPDQDHD